MKCLTRTIYLFVLQAATRSGISNLHAKAFFSHSCIFHFHFLFNKFLLFFFPCGLGSYSDLVTIELVEGFSFILTISLAFYGFFPLILFLWSYMIIFKSISTKLCRRRSQDKSKKVLRGDHQSYCKTTPKNIIFLIIY